MTLATWTGRRCGRIALVGSSWFCLLWAAALSGCGAPAAPQPPTLNLPQPVRDLAGARVGNTVHLTFAVPEKTTDKLPVRGAMTARLCRSIEAGPCQPVDTITLAAQQKTASLDDALPPEFCQGPPRLLTYRVAILNSGAKSAADSNPAFSAAGGPPAPIAAFAVTPQRKGILLNWQAADVPAGVNGWVRFNRTRTSGPSAPVSQPEIGGKSQEEPADQSLRVPETLAEHRPVAVDATAHTGSSYRYTAQRIVQITLQKHSLNLASTISAPVSVAYNDVFPPPVPTGLISAVDTPGKAIDMSWTPDVDSGLAGYIVYRRAAASSDAPQRVSPAKPVVAPAWRDTTVVPGQRYAYSVSAIDVSGNESQRSAEVEDGLTASSPHP